MTSLTQTAIITRKIIRYSLYLIIALIVGKITIGVGIKTYKHFFPEPPPPPTVGFGPLPSLIFPKDQTVDNLEFVLETPDGELPIFPDQAKVYFMPKPIQTQLNLEIAKDKAAKLGFTSSPEQISSTIYRFKHPTSPSSLEINIVTGIFSISYDLQADSSPLERRPPAPEIAIAQAKSYLASAGLLPEDLAGPTNYEFIKIEEGRLSQAVSLSEADLVKVGLFRKKFNELPSLTPNPNQANIWFLVSGARKKEKQIVAGQFRYFTVDEDKSETYPIKTAAAAWEELKNGQAYLAHPPIAGQTKIAIRRVYLAYYDPEVETEFYQPIIVFDEGVKGGFVAYVPAVTDEYYGD
jgi:hypothetical protein